MPSFRVVCGPADCLMWARSGPQQLYCLGQPQGEVIPCNKKLKLAQACLFWKKQGSGRSDWSTDVWLHIGSIEEPMT